MVHPGRGRLDMWSVVPGPDSAAPEDVSTEEFVTAVRARYPDAKVVVNDADDPAAARVTVVGAAVSCSLLKRGLTADTPDESLYPVVGLEEW